MSKRLSRVALTVSSAALFGLCSTTAYAQLVGKDREDFIKGSFNGCMARTQNRTDVSETAKKTFCTCLAEEQANLTTPEDLAYYEKNKRAPDDYERRMVQPVSGCNTAAGLR